MPVPLLMEHLHIFSGMSVSPVRNLITRTAEIAVLLLKDIAAIPAVYVFLFQWYSHPAYRRVAYGDLPVQNLKRMVKRYALLLYTYYNQELRVA